nr:putative integron gene cassette protein [uncultured bacterium]
MAKQLFITSAATLGLVAWAHSLPTIGGRVPMVFIAMWFGSSTIVALIFRNALQDPKTPEVWHRRTGRSLAWLLPLAAIPALEMKGVSYTPSVWLLDCSLLISVCCTPYFTIISRSVVGGVSLSVAAFQGLWIIGASVCFNIMQNSIQANGGHIEPGAAFEEFFRRPEYTYLFYYLCGLMMLVYCPILLCLGRRRFVKIYPI